MKRILFLLITLVMILATACQPGNNEAGNANGELRKVTLVLDWIPNTNHVGFYVAQASGFYEQEGLDVEIIQPAEGGSADLVAAGQGDFGVSYQEQVMYARSAENPLPIRAIATIIQHNTSGFASPVEKNILKPRDFEGKKYGGWGSPMEEALLRSLMELDGADFSKLEMVDIGAADFFSSVQHSVDFTWIYYGWDGIAAEQKGMELNFMNLKDMYSDLDFYSPLIIASEDTIDQDPELVRKFLSATGKGYTFAMAEPKSAGGILTRLVPEIDAELAQGSLSYLKDQFQADAPRWGEMQLSVWENFGKWMQDNALIGEGFIPEEAFTNEFLPQ